MPNSSSERVRRWRERNPERHREHTNKRNRKIQAARYGLTPEEHSERLALPCEMCGAHDGNAQDHDHSTGANRGTLCRSCNVALGHFKDSPERLEAALAYLSRYA